MAFNTLAAPVARPDESALVAFCQRLIQTPSSTGSEGPVADLVRETMLELGFHRAWIDRSGSVVGEIRGTRSGPSVLFDGHIDTVEVADGPDWSRPPFGGVIQDGRIYGRGADDMKCALAAMVFGLAPLAVLPDRLRGSIFVSGTVCEETFEGQALGRVVEEIQPDYVVIGEASALDLKRGQRGRAEVEVTVTGKAAHSSNPSVGRNAVYLAMELVQRMRRAPLPSDPFLGHGLMELTDIISTPYPGASVVPHQCRVTFDRRLLPGESEADVLEPLRRCVRECQAEDPRFEAVIRIVEASQRCYTGDAVTGKRFFPAWVLAEDHPLVAAALAGLRSAGLDPALTKYDFCTNGSYSAGVAGIPTIGFGPGAEDGAHVVDENIELEQVQRAAVGYQAIAWRLLKVERDAVPDPRANPSR
jgi:putative selenium metabolism hydrolase